MSTTPNSVLIYEFWFPWDIVNCLHVYCILVAILQFMLWKENELTDAGVKKSKPQSLKDLVIDYSADMFTCLLSPNSDHMMIHLLAYNCAIWQWRLCMRVCPNRTVVISQMNHHTIWIGWQQACKHISGMRLLKGCTE